MRNFISHFVASIVVVTCSLHLHSEVVIPMQKYGGVYKVSCNINGAKMKMIFDTGAATVSLSRAMAQYLYDNEYISDSDFLEQGQSQTADGRIVDHLKINIKDLEIGGLGGENVTAIVISNQSAPLLLGQSAIQKLGRFQIEGDKLIILDADNELSEEEIDEYAEIAGKAIKDHDFAKSELYYSKLYNGGYLTNKGIWWYSYACSMNHNYNKELQLLKELEDSEYSKSETYDILSIQFNLFLRMALCYIDLDMSGWESYVEKAISIVPPSMKLANGKSITTDNSIIPCIYANIAASLIEKEIYDDAAHYYREALGSYAKHYGLSTSALWNVMLGKVKNINLSKNESIQRDAFLYAKCRWLSYAISNDEFLSILLSLAHNNNESARIFCNETEIEY